MRGARCWTLAALALMPLTACVLFDGPSDYPPRDAGGQDVATIADAANGHDATSTADSGGVSDAAAPVDDARADATGTDGSPVDARSDVNCTASGAACVTDAACCSGSCTATMKCK